MKDFPYPFLKNLKRTFVLFFERSENFLFSVFYVFGRCNSVLGKEGSVKARIIVKAAVSGSGCGLDAA